MLARMGSIAWGWRSTIQTGDLLTTGKCGPFLDVGKSCSADGEAAARSTPLGDAASSTCKGGAVIGTSCDPTAFASGCTTNAYCDGNTSKCSVPVWPRRGLARLRAGLRRLSAGRRALPRRNLRLAHQQVRR